MLPSVGDLFPNIDAFKHEMQTNAFQEGYQYGTVRLAEELVEHADYKASGVAARCI
jgi:hypothetical protein